MHPNQQPRSNATTVESGLKRALPCLRPYLSADPLAMYLSCMVGIDTDTGGIMWRLCLLWLISQVCAKSHQEIVYVTDVPIFSQLVSLCAIEAVLSAPFLVLIL